jgi:hypothetical protein
MVKTTRFACGFGSVLTVFLLISALLKVYPPARFLE